MMTQTLIPDKLQQAAIATRTVKCDRLISYYNAVLPLLTDARIYAQKLEGHRFFVELASAVSVSRTVYKDWELQDDYPVPKRQEKVDVVVVEPSKAAICSLVDSCKWLKGYQIISYQQPEDGCEF